MNHRKSLCLGLAGLLLTFGLTGCQTGESPAAGMSGNIKAQGVYTTLALDAELDLPGSGYLSKSSFGPGETPAAVIVGYGGYNQPQLLSLEVIESSTGRSLLAKDYYANYGKVVIQPLAIRLSGEYQVRLLSNGKQWDSCQFTVTRTNYAGPTPVAATSSEASYGHGDFDVLIESSGNSGMFDKYDEKLIYNMLIAVTKDAEKAHHELFAQRFPGKVVIQCNQDFTGRITSPNIVENTLDAECGAVLQQAVLARSPYAAWPEAVHREFAADNRSVKITIGFN